MKVVQSKVTQLKKYKDQLSSIRKVDPIGKMAIEQRINIINIAIHNGLQFLGLRK